jgi:hypothetical protein
MLCRPLLAFDYGREAYVLRGFGGRHGPVLRKDRRRGGPAGYGGPERRAAQPAEARPMEAAEPPASTSPGPPPGPAVRS